MLDSGGEYFSTAFHDKELIEILCSDEKTKRQKGEIIYQRVKQIKFFASFFENHLKDSNPSFLLELCSKITYEKLEKGKVLFMQNDPSNNKLYVILVGKVFVMKKEDLDTIINIRDRQKSIKKLNIPEHFLNKELRVKVLPSNQPLDEPSIPIPKSAVFKKSIMKNNPESPQLGEMSSSSSSIKYIVTPLGKRSSMGMDSNEINRDQNFTRNTGKGRQLFKDGENTPGAGTVGRKTKKLKRHGANKSCDQMLLRKMIANYESMISKEIRDLYKPKLKKAEKSFEQSNTSYSDEDDLDIDEFTSGFQIAEEKKFKKKIENMDRRYSHFSNSSLISGLQDKFQARAGGPINKPEEGNTTTTNHQTEGQNKAENISEKSHEHSDGKSNHSTSIKNYMVQVKVNESKESTKREEEAAMMKQPVKVSTKDMIDPEELAEMIAVFGKVLRIMEAGEALGEKALFENSKRTATIATGTKCEFLVLEKKDFQFVLDSIKEAFEARRRLIFQIFSEFKNEYSSKILDNMIYSFTTEVYFKGDYLCREGQNGEKIFIIEEGEINIERSIHDRSKTSAEFKRKNINICALGRGTIVGEEILFTSDSKYHYSAKVVSSSVRVLVALRSLINAKFPIEMKRFLINTFIQKDEIRAHLYEEKLKYNTPTISKEDYEKEFFVKADIKVGGILRPGLYESFNSIITRSNPAPVESKPVLSSINEEEAVIKAKDVFAECDRHKFKLNQQANSYKVPAGRSFLKDKIAAFSGENSKAKATQVNLAHDFYLPNNEYQIKKKISRMKRNETLRKSGLNSENVDIKDLLFCEEKYLERLKAKSISQDFNGQPVGNMLDFGDGQNDSIWRRIKFLKVMKNIHKLGGYIEQDGVNLGPESLFVNKIEKRIERYQNRKTKDLNNNSEEAFMATGEHSRNRSALTSESFLPSLQKTAKKFDSVRPSQRLCTGSSFYLFSRGLMKTEESNSSLRLNTNNSKVSGFDSGPENFPSVSSNEKKRKEKMNDNSEVSIIHSDSKKSLKNMTIGQSLNYKASRKKALSKK